MPQPAASANSIQPPATPSSLLDTLQDRASERQLCILTGERGAGKTAWCRALIGAARARGLTVSGLLSPALFEAGTKTGILLQDLASGACRELAVLNAGGETSLGLKWRFDDAVLAWGNDILSAAGAADILVLDELGPLEFTHARGFNAAFTLLDSGHYRLACVVIRPELLNAALARWPAARVISIPQPV